MGEIGDLTGGGLNFPNLANSKGSKDPFVNIIFYDNEAQAVLDYVGTDFKAEKVHGYYQWTENGEDALGSYKDDGTEKRAHEIIGHSYIINTSNNKYEHSLVAIQVSNLVKVALGHEKIRTGTSHQPSIKAKDAKQISKVPKNLKK